MFASALASWALRALSLLQTDIASRMMNSDQTEPNPGVPTVSPGRELNAIIAPQANISFKPWHRLFVPEQLSVTRLFGPNLSFG